MNFQPELAQAVMTGRKTVTRRLVSDNPRSPWWRDKCSLNVGQDYAVCPGRGKHAIGRVRVVALWRERLGDVFGDTLGVNDTGDAHGYREAVREGFRNATSFKLAWLKINGDYDPDSPVWRVEMEVSEVFVCKACDHRGDDCVCWYVAEMAAGERDEATA